MGGRGTLKERPPGILDPDPDLCVVGVTVQPVFVLKEIKPSVVNWKCVVYYFLF